MRRIAFLSLIIALVLNCQTAFAQYNTEAVGKNVIQEPAVNLDGTVKRDKEGKIKYKRVTADKYGNAAGNQYDLAVDGAFIGQTVAVLHFYTGEGFDFSLPKAALKEKGFSTYRWLNTAPSPEELEKKLEGACQLWIISSHQQQLNAKHLKVIKKFFNSGKGVYIWGDNQPFYSDANYVSEALLGTSMNGNLMGDKTVMADEAENVGLAAGHMISTGLEYVYEGITIATITKTEDLTPLIYGSAGNLVTAVYDKGGKRAILDGGFTRLYINWDTAGTARYVKNAAAWLVNYERFGEEVVSENVRDN